MERLTKPVMKSVGVILALLAIALGVSYVSQEEQIQRIFGVFGERAVKIWTAPLLTLGGLRVSPMFLLKAAVFLILLVFISRAARRILQKRILSHTSLDPGLQYALDAGTGYLVFILGLIVGLQSVGINLSSLAFLTGIIGVGVGFGMQNILSNFVSGLILLVERPVKVGDRVEVGDLSGDIVRIGARSTWVRTNDNVVIIVPNAEFISNRVTNWTANDRRVRISVPLGTAYSCDPAAVRDLLLRIATAQPDILMDPAPDVVFQGFGDSSLNFELRVWTEDSLRTPLVLKSNLYYAIFRAFSENNIEIPFPQRDIHVRSVATSIPLSVDARAPLQNGRA
ncbi:MAG TPA: mechanosensitive ion channel domain-containing protein [Bryobacteraceae bacterium]|nr:mechanosensitive ion channel domain-containing protein [Bryobacteraceae bacterium]